ncbi:MAG TPA: biotin-dependent carboxyltransferase family protein [Micromonosporaceae bacterium]|nr:biotin-dependent carboxyltransferase family protein [Micromonosporaceae bacterium]
MIEILRAGALTTVQDLGRRGLAHLGVARSGAADRDSLRLANRLVGNREGAACLEITFGGFGARFHEAAIVAVAGAPCPVRVSDHQAFMYGPIQLNAGDELSVGPPAQGVRTYLAVRGGVDVPPVLGSRSTDVLAGLGPDPLWSGMLLSVGTDARELPGVDVAPVAPIPEEITLRVMPGPRDDWFTPAALTVLTSNPYEVTAQSNRVGIRLSGAMLERSRTGELPSEGTVCGSLQVPPSGQPVLFLADHPVTGGYPVIAVVWEQDICLAAQARPGQRLRFHAVMPR